MNELVAIFNNCIKSKSSLKECVEFAFHDEEIGMGEKGKLVALITDGGSKKANMTDAYKAMLPESKKVADGEYLYIIAAYDWSVTEPEAEFEFAVLDTVQMYSGHKAVVSIHVCDEAIYTHTLIKKTPGLEWPGPKELPEFCAINHDTPSAVIEYCEAMRYLMY